MKMFLMGYGPATRTIQVKVPTTGKAFAGPLFAKRRGQ